MLSSVRQVRQKKNKKKHWRLTGTGQSIETSCLHPHLKCQCQCKYVTFRDWDLSVKAGKIIITPDDLFVAVTVGRLEKKKNTLNFKPTLLTASCPQYNALQDS